MASWHHVKKRAKYTIPAASTSSNARDGHATKGARHAPEVLPDLEERLGGERRPAV